MGAYYRQQCDHSEDTISRTINTHVAGLGITANPSALETGGSTVNPGDPGMTLRGTRVSLDSAGELVLGSQTIAFEGVRGGSGGDKLITTVAGQALTANPTPAK